VDLDEAPSDAVPTEEGGDVLLQALEEGSRFDAWRAEASLLQPKAKKHLPPDRWTALTLSTSELLKRRWSKAPGSRWVSYAVHTPTSQRRRGAVLCTAPTSAWFELAGSVLPRVEETVRVGALVRRGLMGCAKRLLGEDHLPSQLVGRDDDGAPLRGHRHAYFLPVDVDGDGRIDHVLVHAREGLVPELRLVLQDFRWFMGPGAHEVRAVLVDLGTEIPDCPLLSTSTRWVSSTPFVLPRHPKLRGGGRPRRDVEGRWIEGPAWQLRAGLRQLGLPEPLELDSEDGQARGGLEARGREIRWHRFRRKRLTGDGAKGSRRGHGFEVRFGAPVRGPIALGYGAHFGLGQLWPEPD
jgi:CRISPR-associated protein Csb2